MSESMIAKNLVYLREENDYSQKDVSSVINVTRQTYSNYETGKRVPGLDTIIKLSKFYSISIDSLVESDLSQPIIKEISPYGHDVTNPGGGSIRISGTDAKMLANYLSLTPDEREEVRSIILLKKQKENHAKEREKNRENEKSGK